MTKLVVLTVVIILAALSIFYFRKTPPTSQVKIQAPAQISREEILPPRELEGYSGKVLAGNRSPLLDFKKGDYDKATASNKLIVLYFYANWCPICKEEIPKLAGAFNELQTDKVVGFRINFNDNETDNNEKKLAEEFGVGYQHTKVFVRNGQRLLKSPESWDKDRYLKEIEDKS